MRIDRIHDRGGDWVALYVDGRLRFQGHVIRDEDYDTLFNELGAVTNDYQESDFSDGSGAPELLEDVEITYG